jgi:ABC-type uncharacterized transport system auxiliary subunit
MKELWTLDNKNTPLASLVASGLKVFLAVTLGAAIASACSSLVKLQSEYPKTSYYRLDYRLAPPSQTAQPLRTTPEERVREIVLVKGFAIDSEFDTDHLLAFTPSAEIQRYQYHRWISEPRELVTAFVINRLQASELFSGGVFAEASGVMPTVELEGRIVEYAGKNAAGANGAVLTMHVAVRRITDTSSAQTILFQKTYSQSVARLSDSAASIPPALSLALAAATDSLCKDVAQALRRK